MSSLRVERDTVKLAVGVDKPHTPRFCDETLAMRHHIFIYTQRCDFNLSLRRAGRRLCAQRSRVGDMTFQFVFAGMRRENRLLLYIVYTRP